MIYILDQVDIWRANWIKLLFRFPFGRLLFLNKEFRIIVSGVFGILFSVLLFLQWPVLVLVVSPLIFGIPHLLASLRYSTVNKSSVRRFSAGIFIFGSILLAIKWHYPHLLTVVDFYTVLLSFFILSFGWHAWRSSGIRWYGLLGFTATAAALALYPGWFLTKLLIGHNLIAIVFWWGHCKKPKQKWCVLFYTLFLGLFCILVLLGFFDQSLYHTLSSHWFTKLIPIFSPNLEQGMRLVFIYGVTQAAHYFVWLRAIPEVSMKGRATPCWKKSWNMLRRDFSNAGAVLALTLVIVSLGAWLVLGLQDAHNWYVSIAAFHGFYEIAALLAVNSFAIGHNQ